MAVMHHVITLDHDHLDDEAFSQLLGALTTWRDRGLLGYGFDEANRLLIITFSNRDRMVEFMMIWG